jgi:hypothetical protein
MQIPGVSSAAQAASIVAQATSKDKASENQTANTSHPSAADSTVERSGEANPDRDAQGQGDGLPGESSHPTDEMELESADDSPQPTKTAPSLPDEPPSQLDIIG